MRARKRSRMPQAMQRRRRRGPKKVSVRKPLPSHLVRERIVHDLAESEKRCTRRWSYPNSVIISRCTGKSRCSRGMALRFRAKRCAGGWLGWPI